MNGNSTSVLVRGLWFQRRVALSPKRITAAFLVRLGIRHGRIAQEYFTSIAVEESSKCSAVRGLGSDI